MTITRALAIGLTTIALAGCPDRNGDRVPEPQAQIDRDTDRTGQPTQPAPNNAPP